MRKITPLALAALALTGCATMQPTAGSDAVPVWGRFEQSFTAPGADPDTPFQVTFLSPTGRQQTVDGFWDGGDLWKVRFMPDAVGTWSYRTRADAPALNDRTGSFSATPATVSDNPFLRHGAVRVSDDGRHFVHADGTPFFWLADTGWNAALKSTDEAFDTYLDRREEQGFTAIQFITTNWRASPTNLEGETAYTGFEEIQIHPEFFDRIDERIDEINAEGFLAVPVLLWTLGQPHEVPGKLPEDQAIKLARYIAARYSAHHVAYFLTGDENFRDEEIRERWRRVGRAVFPRPDHPPVSLHPRGRQFEFETLLNEEWLDFLIYQSGHHDTPEALNWIHSGQVPEVWDRWTPARPIINSEPPYEAHFSRQRDEPTRPFEAYEIRRAMYWSLLNAPTAGVTYGGHGIWSWETEPAEPLSHRGTGIAPTWRDALELPGAEDMRHLNDLFTSIDWWTLRPDQRVLVEQPFSELNLATGFVTAARSESGDLAVLYLPVGADITVRRELVRATNAEWFDPRTGDRRAAVPITGSTYRPPDGRDWVLLFS